MSENREREINKLVRETYAAANLDYDSISQRVVPLFEIITSHDLYVEQLPRDKDLNKNKLTADRAVDFIKQEMGLEVNNHLTQASDLSGYIYATHARGITLGCIFTDSGEITTRRRFSAAHELGHYLLHFLPRDLPQTKSDEDNGFSIFTEGVSFAESGEANELSEIKIIRGYEEDETIPVDGDEMEREANFFAAELLMPCNACLTLAQTYRERFGASKTVVVKRLAAEFLVSFEAMLRRLKDLRFYEG